MWKNENKVWINCSLTNPKCKIMLAFVWNHQDSFSCSNKNYTFIFLFFLLCCILVHISLYYNVLQNIFSYLIIKNKTQHVSLAKKYIYTKNQDIDFFSYKIYIIYYSVITLLWDGFGTIIYKS